MDYSPYSDIKKVYDAKVSWGNATTAEEKARMNELATAARESLKANGYEYIANAISADGANVDAVKVIMDQWAPTKTPNTINSNPSYNPYNEVKTVYDAKVAWGNETTDAGRSKQAAIADAARQTLEYYGYGDVANQVSADGANAEAVKKVLDQWANVTDTGTGTYKTGVDDNPAYNKTIAAAQDKNARRDSVIYEDHDNINSMYKDLFGYANSDVTETEEYKSAFDNIMPSYNLAAMQGRQNELASGSASNGGNVDSFAAANAMRQQSELTAKGQALAHQIGLETYAARVDRANSILSNLGVYNSGVYSALNEGVVNDLNIANSIFANAETAKTNTVDNNVKMSAVTGYVPTDWAVQSDMRTADYDLTTKQIESAERMGVAGNQADLEKTKLTVDGAIQQQKIQAETDKYAADLALQAQAGGNNSYAAYNLLLGQFDASDTGPRNFIEKYIKPIYEGGTITPEGLKTLIVSNTEKYNIDVEDAKEICRAFSMDLTWLNDYEDRTGADQYKGMKRKGSK